LGNPGDANEGDFETISAAVDLYAYAGIRPAEDKTLEQTDSDFPSVCFRLSDLPIPYNGSLDLLKGAVNRFYTFHAEFQKNCLCMASICEPTSLEMSELSGFWHFVFKTKNYIIFIDA
jgi:hypothetical protein